MNEMNEINTDKEILIGDVLLKRKQYWLDKLAGELSKSYFPYDYYDYHVAKIDVDSTSQVKFTIGGEIFSRLMKLRNDSDPRLHMIMVAVIDILLHRYSGINDIIVGTTIDKQEGEAEYINTILPLRNQIADHMTFKELLMQVRNVFIGAVENQNYPVEELVEQLHAQLHGHTGGKIATLFEVAILLENIQDQKYLRHIRPAILFSFKRTNENITLTVEYQSSLYKKDTIERIIEHFNRVLEIVIFDVDREFSSIDLLSPGERQELIVDFNNTARCYPDQKTVHELFELQAAKYPEAVALIAGDNNIKISYRELNARANRLARVLREKGVTGDTIVALITQPSPEALTAIIAILKAGAAYLPIDPSYPPERIRYMLEDSQAMLVLAAKTVDEKIVSSHVSPHLLMTLDDENSDNENSAGDNESNIAMSYDPANLAYIIYTSGTTGNPKGVMIEHRGLANYIRWAARVYVHDEKIDFPLYTTLGFDLTVTSIFTPLITGNTVFIYSGEEKEFLLTKIVTENKVAAVKLTPVHLMVLADNKTGNQTSKIKRLIVGGDKLETQWAQKIHDLFAGNVEIYNEYGPTEATVGCMIYKFNPLKDKSPSVPVGVPAENVRIYLLDQYLNHAPARGMGELYIAGDGLARGYLDRPELTAERFVPNPFAPGEKMYKTGDIALRLADGNIEFLGRMDQQVKIRGYRIETGEVENRLLNHGGIDQAVVVAKKDAEGYYYLAAYIVPANKTDRTAFNVQQLRNELAESLPEFMLPSYFIPLASLPVTAGGKVDRQALPEPSFDRTGSGIEYRAPENEVEHIMVDVWREVFNVEVVSVMDNYFSLGGDSIKAIQLSARLLEFNLKVAIADFFSYPTIQELAKAAKKTERLIEQGPVAGDVPLTPIQHWFFDKIHNPANPGFISHFNQSVMLYKKDGFDAGIVQKVFTRIVEHHDALRMVYKIEDGQVRQTNKGLAGKLAGKFFDLDIIVLENAATVEQEIKKECERIQSGIDLSEGPLIKLGLFKTPGGDHLLIAVHHLVMDAVSGRIIMEDFDSGYRQLSSGNELKFPNKTDSFRDWALRLNQDASGPAALKELAYWEKIENIESDPLPTDGKTLAKKGTRKYKDRETIHFTLTESETSQLLKEVNRVYNTEINDILLAGLGLALKDWAKIAKVRVNLEGHGRENILENIDISRTLGWFTSQYPVLLDMAGAGIPGGIKTVKDTLRRIPDKGIRYGMLRYLTTHLTTHLNTHLNTDEIKEKKPLTGEPEIGFNYLGQFEQTDPGKRDYSMFEFSPLPKGTDVNPELESTYRLEIIGLVTQGVLWMGIHYDKYEYQESAIKKFAGYFKENLTKIIDHCVRKEVSEKTLSDFTASDLETEDMAAILDELGAELDADDADEADEKEYD